MKLVWIDATTQEVSELPWLRELVTSATAASESPDPRLVEEELDWGPPGTLPPDVAKVIRRYSKSAGVAEACTSLTERVLGWESWTVAVQERRSVGKPPESFRFYDSDLKPGERATALAYVFPSPAHVSVRLEEADVPDLATSYPSAYLRRTHDRRYQVAVRLVGEEAVDQASDLILRAAEKLLLEIVDRT